MVGCDTLFIELSIVPQISFACYKMYVFSDFLPTNCNTYFMNVRISSCGRIACFIAIHGDKIRKRFQILRAYSSHREE